MFERTLSEKLCIYPVGQRFQDVGPDNLTLIISYGYTLLLKALSL
jgi:hypothetical protein